MALLLHSSSFLQDNIQLIIYSRTYSESIKKDIATTPQRGGLSSEPILRNAECRMKVHDLAVWKRPFRWDARRLPVAFNSPVDSSPDLWAVDIFWHRKAFFSWALLVAMRSQRTGFVQKRRREKINNKWKGKEWAQHLWYLMLIAVLKACLWKVWGKWQHCFFILSSLLPFLQMANINIYEKKQQRLIGLRRLSNVKLLSNGEHVFLSKDTSRRESVTFQMDWKSLIPSYAALGAIWKPCSLQGLHFPIWFKSAVGDTGCL